MKNLNITETVNGIINSDEKFDIKMSLLNQLHNATAQAFDFLEASKRVQTQQWALTNPKFARFEE